MKNGMFTIFRKEMARFFGDKRTALAAILLPGVLIFAVYTFMGSALANQFSVDEDFAPTVQAVNLPGSVAALAGQSGLTLEATLRQCVCKNGEMLDACIHALIREEAT